MKKFVFENWYKLMVGSSLMIASFAFLLHAITPSHASDLNKGSNSGLPINTDGTISVKLSEEQLKRIIPKNEDGSINIRISDS